MIRLTGPLWLWNGEGASWHFFTVPEDQADPIRAHRFEGPRRGFGSVRVEARIGEIAWRTSLFPQKSGGFILPIKAEIRRRAGISVGDDVTLTLDLL